MNDRSLHVHERSESACAGTIGVRTCANDRSLHSVLQLGASMCAFLHWCARHRPEPPAGWEVQGAKGWPKGGLLYVYATAPVATAPRGGMRIVTWISDAAPGWVHSRATW
eukprot:147639-Chlamydomonas_euryale.AAC.1